MSDAHLPTEVELVYELMPCNALRTAQEPAGPPHACSYFRKWGTYHSYDYAIDGPPPERGIVHETLYLGRGPLVPEMLSGCRKAPIMSVGINPNLPGWWRGQRGWLNPLFDDYKQYAHYFRYRAVAKVGVPEQKYEELGGGPHDTPFSQFQLHVLPDDAGERHIPVTLLEQKMYLAYQDLLNGLAEGMGWDDADLQVGEDLAYGNMVACPSAKWTTVPDPNDPALPPMTLEERSGIVTECFRERQYFLRQLFQSLPAVLLVFSQSTANALIRELGGRLVLGDPQPEEPIAQLGAREIRLRYGLDEQGTALEARVIFAPHITGNPAEYGPARTRVVAQLVEEAQAGRLRYNPATRHLARPRGACVFCTMLQIGPCDYVDELRPLATPPALLADVPGAQLLADKAAQATLVAEAAAGAPPVAEAWENTDESTADRGEEP